MAECSTPAVCQGSSWLHASKLHVCLWLAFPQMAERKRRTVMDRNFSDLPLDLKPGTDTKKAWAKGYYYINFRSNIMQCSLHAQSQQVLHKASPPWQSPLCISVCCLPPGARLRHFYSISCRKRRSQPDLCQQARALSPAAMVRLYAACCQPLSAAHGAKCLITGKAGNSPRQP